MKGAEHDNGNVKTGEITVKFRVLHACKVLQLLCTEVHFFFPFVLPPQENLLVLFMQPECKKANPSMFLPKP